MPVKELKQLTCDLCKTTKLEGEATKKWTIIEISDAVYTEYKKTCIICKTCAHKIERSRVLQKSINRKDYYK